MDAFNAISDRSFDNDFQSDQPITVGQIRSQEDVVTSSEASDCNEGFDSLREALTEIENGTDSIHPLARERFDDWVSSSRSCINIFVDEGLVLKAQYDILTQIKAPTKIR